MAADKQDQDLTPIERSEPEWRRLLSDEEYQVTRQAGTERAFSGRYCDQKEPGRYLCRCCGLPLFEAETKFDSGSGWPSFYQPANRSHVQERSDGSHGMVRTEVLCARCDAHLGHMFDDGPAPTGQRYCMNSASLDFETRETGTVATFGAGCFWGIEQTFRQLEGVVATAVGYMGGHVQRPTYEMTCSGDTGHAEVVHVRFDPAKLSYADLLRTFWQGHDPTQHNRQGPDVGTQYRSVIFYHDAEQEKAARAALEAEERSGRHMAPIATEVAKAGTFWRAEEYHQQYLEKNGDAVCPTHLRK